MEKWNEETWATKEFADARLGHKARNKRAIQIACSLIKAPRSSIPKAMGKWSHIKGSYRFFSNRNVTHQGVLSGHLKETAERCRLYSEVLVIQDTTALTYNGHSSVKGLGPVSFQEEGRGFLVHTNMGVSRETKEVLGVLDQHPWVRSKKKQCREETQRQRSKRKRESEKWGESARRVRELFNDNAEGRNNPRLIHVCDREADIFEFIEEMDELGDSFIIRASRNRLLKSDTGERTYSLEEVEKSDVIATKEVSIPGRTGRSAYTAKLEIRAVRVNLQPPKIRDRCGEFQWVNLVWAHETHPRAGKKPLSWYLMTRESIETKGDALQIVSDYEARWLIEELHMGIKTGCACEQRQLESIEALMNLLAFATVIAWQLLALRDAARRSRTRPASDILTQTQIKTLSVLRSEINPDCTAYEALRAIANMGGFIGRKSDGEPGWRTIWRGFQDLLMAEAGFKAALELS